MYERSRLKSSPSLSAEYSRLIPLSSMARNSIFKGSGSCFAWQEEDESFGFMTQEELDSVCQAESQAGFDVKGSERSLPCLPQGKKKNHIQQMAHSHSFIKASLEKSEALSTLAAFGPISSSCESQSSPATSSPPAWSKPTGRRRAREAMNSSEKEISAEGKSNHNSLSRAGCDHPSTVLTRYNLESTV